MLQNWKWDSMTTASVICRGTNATENKKDRWLPCFLINIRMEENEDLFEIVDFPVYENQTHRMERFRDLCERLVPSAPCTTASVEWHHLVDLFCAFTYILGKAERFKNYVTSVNTSHQTSLGNWSYYLPEVSAWFRDGLFPDHTRVFLNHNRPWQAQVFFDLPKGYNGIWTNSYSPCKETILNYTLQNPAVPLQTSSDDLQIHIGETYIDSSTLMSQNSIKKREKDQIDQIPYTSNFVSHELPSTTSPTLSTVSCNSSTPFCGLSPLNFPPQLQNFTQKTRLSNTSLCPSKERISKKALKKASQLANPQTSYDNSDEFYTCRSVLGFERQLTLNQALLATASGLNLIKYRGDITSSRIRDQLLRDSENCSLRLTEISPRVSDKEIFNKIDTGKVYFYQRLPSRPGIHHTCAANLAFFERRSAENFYLKCSTEPGIWLDGYRIRAFWNRDKSGPPLNTYISRVINIYGPANFRYGKEQFLSRKGLEIFFQGKFHYTLVDSFEWMIDSNMKAVRLEFGSARCQGQFAKMSLSRLIRKNDWHDILRVEYQPDPCNQC
ncbi:hypothetical protein OnM2_059043 [Erysiphe neolycopersici]|uniref:Uncharacterized protein n=1 Tax=Erysiphe neolycopersici TaxID=212602 RepID=A0A420HQ55_9PEZI|nr:hypothetical protein OnM2_059043 [Erysiphe neolycopersici]